SSAIARPRLQALAASAATPGFARALLRLVDELEERRIAPGRWWAAMREWGEREPARAAYAEELARLYGAYRDRLGARGRPRAPPPPRSSPGSTAPIATGWRPSGAATASCTIRPRSTRCAWSRRA